MVDHRIIDIKTGRPLFGEPSELHLPWKLDSTPLSENVFVEKFMEAAEESYEEKHARFCSSVEKMLGHCVDTLQILQNIASADEKLLRSVKWLDRDGFTTTIPVALKSVRRDLEWLEGFFKREPRK